MFPYGVLGYRIDAYFPKQRLAIKVDELGHQDRDFEAEIERQKSIQQKLNSKFIRINPAKKSFNVFDEIGRVQVFVSASNEKSFLKNTLDILLDVEFKPNKTRKQSV